MKQKTERYYVLQTGEYRTRRAKTFEIKACKICSKKFKPKGGMHFYCQRCRRKLKNEYSVKRNQRLKAMAQLARSLMSKGYIIRYYTDRIDIVGHKD